MEKNIPREIPKYSTDNPYVNLVNTFAKIRLANLPYLERIEQERLAVRTAIDRFTGQPISQESP